MSNKIVSVIIPTYNRPVMLKRTITSVLNQTYKNIEIIVVDDNNPNTEARKETKNLLQSITDYRVKYVKHSHNKNGSAARNTGFLASKGDYIMFLDDDDEFNEFKVERQLNRLESLPNEWGACYTGYLQKTKGKIVMRSNEKREGDLLVDVLGRNLFVHAGSNLMIRRSVVKAINGFDENFKRNQDIEFLVRILKKYKFSYVDYVGLVVNKDDRTNSNVNFVDLTNQYKEKFQEEINALTEKEKQTVYALINLQVFRHFLVKFKWIKAIKVLINYDISILMALKYLVHLAKRKILKRAYGFSI